MQFYHLPSLNTFEKERPSSQSGSFLMIMICKDHSPYSERYCKSIVGGQVGAAPVVSVA